MSDLEDPLALAGGIAFDDLVVSIDDAQGELLRFFKCMSLITGSSA
jgi:hypothetical protein